MADELGIREKKEQDPNAWYTEIVTKAELIDYTEVSGCYILRPKAQYIWDTIRTVMDARLKERGVKNASFPLLIPERLLKTEEEHVEGFTPEVAWVTHAGETLLPERLAIRPTSETIMYPAYAKWIRSHKNLPLKLNQWCSVVRWEFKHPMPFLRSREFLWQEGHTAFATQQEAEEEAMDILIGVYKYVYEELLAVPCIAGIKTLREKFAGATHSLSCECYLPIGKAVQGCTSHYLGTNFAKAFNITYTAEDQQTHHVHQNSWGFSTRAIGVTVMMHSDNKGLILPPRVAQNRLCILPVFGKVVDGKSSNADVIEYCETLAEMLREHDPIVDSREQHTFGFRIADAELSGVPLRLDVGPKEMVEGKVTLVRRDTGVKESVFVRDLVAYIPQVLDSIHSNLFARAKAVLDGAIVEEHASVERIAALVAEGKIVLTPYDGDGATDDMIRETTGGKTLCIPFGKHPEAGAVCVFSGKPARHVVYIGKSL